MHRLPEFIYTNVDMYSVVCPNEGVITGIIYPINLYKLTNIGFICSSPFGETKFGPYPSSDALQVEEKCPLGTYVGSFYGTSRKLIEQLGIRCVSYEQPEIEIKRSVIGNKVASPFDDERYALQGRRPVEIKVWFSVHLMDIQVKYGNMPIAHNCKGTKIEVMEQNIAAEPDGIEVIGIAVESHCSSLQQQVSLQATQTVEQIVGFEVMDGGDINWETEVSISATLETGVIFAKASVTAGISQAVGGTKTWSTTNTNQTTTGSQKSQGAIYNYEGPGVGVLVGFLNRYKINRHEVSVRYHLSCNGHNGTSKIGKIKLTSTTFGKANFRGYQFKFNSKDNCTPDPRSCVEAIEHENAFNITFLETKLNACFSPNSGVFSRR